MERYDEIIKQKLYSFPKVKNEILILENQLYSCALGKKYSIYKRSNSFEDNIIRKMDCEDRIKKWQELIKKVLAFFYAKKPLYANYLKMKFFKKLNSDEIEKHLKINFKTQEKIEKIIIDFIYKNAKIRNLI